MPDASVARDFATVPVQPPHSELHLHNLRHRAKTQRGPANKAANN
eukprot:CAMPEP_0171155864 /NCGR_PEP_ID=MMETSP0790-20130122/1135_1 /TAXON_ID=2925 /ORGANISM="Alexandrium catenella, Strain OF101" /LENGTH=44 /DNA_ID= /DNA_START= /DNA_END= /DNA_ORIENTATION=